MSLRAPTVASEASENGKILPTDMHWHPACGRDLRPSYPSRLQRGHVLWHRNARVATLIFPCLLLILLPAMGSAVQQSIPALASRAEQLENEGKWQEAADTYCEILKLDPKSIAALNRLGAIYVRREDFERGLRYYRQALELNPDEFGTNLNLGIAYIKMEDYAMAVRPLERATEAEPSDFQARELLGVALIGQNDYARATPQLEKAAQLNSRDVGTLYLLERSYLETKQFEKALGTFEHLESLDPNSPWVRILRGQARDGLGEYKKAIAEFESARQQLPADATVRFSLGFMYWKVRRFGEAESELHETLRLDPRFEEAKYYLADTYLMDQKPEQALPILENLLKARPRDARALLDLGKALEKLGRDEEAAHAYRACLRVDPNRSDAHYQLARVYKKLKQPAEFQRELALAQKLQQEKREREESLLKASGARGDPVQQLRLAPSSKDYAQGQSQQEEIVPAPQH